MISWHLRQAQQKLTVVSDTPSLDAEILLAHVLKKPRSYLHAWPEKVLNERQLAEFSLCINRRIQHEPIAYITGYKEFWSLKLAVNQQTLIPRPETELVVEQLLKLFPADFPCTIADLGTGCGAIALALAYERPSWQIYATDISQSALQIANKNAQRLKLSNISFFLGNWCTALPNDCVDAIVCNPPYLSEQEWVAYEQGLRFEPVRALRAGKDGLTAIREIIYSAKRYIKRRGYLLVEHGFLQGPAVRELFQQKNFYDIKTFSDLAQCQRLTIGSLIA